MSVDGFIGFLIVITALASLTTCAIALWRVYQSRQNNQNRIGAFEFPKEAQPNHANSAPAGNNGNGL